MHRSFETNNRGVSYPKRGWTVNNNLKVNAGSGGCQRPLPGSKLSRLLPNKLKSFELLFKVLPAVCLSLLTFKYLTKYDRCRVLESSTFCCCQLFLFFSGCGGGSGGERRLDNRVVGGLIAICLVLKEFGCLFLLFSNPRIPLLKLPYIRSL